MFRRIEIIYVIGRHKVSTPLTQLPRKKYMWQDIWVKSGLNPFGFLLNFYGVNAPNNIHTNKKIKFFFTEKGWNKVGRQILKIVKQVKLQHRVLSIKEKSVDIIYRDKLQVAVRPRKASSNKAKSNKDISD